MKIEELKETSDALGIEHFNERENFICLKGVNGQVSVLYTDKHPHPSTMLDFATHLKQMGRDSLKMDLEKLLNITTHH